MLEVLAAFAEFVALSPKVFVAGHENTLTSARYIRTLSILVLSIYSGHSLHITEDYLAFFTFNTDVTQE